MGVWFLEHGTPLTDMQAPVLSVRNLAVDYGDAHALADVSFDLLRGQATEILGRNGAGKSSLAQAIAGLIKPVTGSVELDCHDITGLPAHRRAKQGIAYVPEDRGIFRGLTVKDNLRLALRCSTPRNQRPAALDRVLGLFPILAARRTLRAGALSGGEQQMLALARVLVAQVSVLIVDEPSMGLAPKIVNSVYESLLQLRASGISLLIVEQFVDKALDFADEVILLRRGRIALRGPTDLVREEVIRTYLATQFLTSRSPNSWWTHEASNDNGLDHCVLQQATFASC